MAIQIYACLINGHSFADPVAAADIQFYCFEDEKEWAKAKNIGDVVKYVHGTKSGDGFNYAWEFAGAAIAHPTCPLVYAMEPW